MKNLRLFLILFFVFVSVSFVYSQNYRVYTISLVYNNGQFELENVGIGLVKNQTPIVGDYNAEIFSFMNASLDTYNFTVPTFVFYDTVDEETGDITGGGLLQLNKTELALELPYFENAREAIIYDSKGREKIRIDLSVFSSDRCGDGICLYPENYEVCNLDCVSGSRDFYCDREEDDVCDPDCIKSVDLDCKKVERSFSGKIKDNIILIFILFLALLLLIWFIRKYFRRKTY